MLSFSQEDILLEYKEKRNLPGAIELKNLSQSPIYYKFKVNRPKFYLVKPDRGLILPAETKKIQFILHRQGLAEALNDRFKCFYITTSQGLDIQSLNNFEDQPSTLKIKLAVKITNLPSGVILSAPASEFKGSQLKSLGANSQYQSGIKGRNSSTLEGIIRQRQDRINTLRKQIEGFQNDKKLTLHSINQKSKESLVPVILASIAGLLFGIGSSMWI